MNKKHLILAFGLLILMITLVCTQMLFGSNFERAVLRENNINNFKEYSFNCNKYNIYLPDEWKITNSIDNGKSIYFSNSDNSISGCLQVFNDRESIEEFAKQDCKNQSLRYDNLKIMPYKDKNNSGILLSYATSINNGYDYQNKCYYLKMKNDRIVKILFNINNEYYKDNLDKVFKYIVTSVEFN